MKTSKKMKKSKIKLLIMDVDGTLTNGEITYSNSGEEFKTFNVKDGLGIKEIAPKNNITCSIITGRTSKIVELRCKEIDIKYLYQNVNNKLECVKNLANQLNISLEEIAYIGDDINDLSAMSVCGLKGCPNDAIKEIKEIVNYKSNLNGGQGAVRDFINYIVYFNEKNSL